jgi:hypothetical protein
MTQRDWHSTEIDVTNRIAACRRRSQGRGGVGRAARECRSAQRAQPRSASSGPTGRSAAGDHAAQQAARRNGVMRTGDAGHPDAPQCPGRARCHRPRGTRSGPCRVCCHWFYGPGERRSSRSGNRRCGAQENGPNSPIEFFNGLSTTEVPTRTIGTCPYNSGPMPTRQCPLPVAISASSIVRSAGCRTCGERKTWANVRLQRLKRLPAAHGIADMEVLCRPAEQRGAVPAG